ncbi:hypothetical protein LPJ73_002176, partial [Coemansia sp. RSA 2703]
MDTLWPTRERPNAGSSCDEQEDEEEEVLASGTLQRGVDDLHVNALAQPPDTHASPQLLSTPPTTPSLDTRIAQLMHAIDVTVDIERAGDLVAELRASHRRLASEQARELRALEQLRASEWAASGARVRAMVRLWAGMVARDRVRVRGDVVAVVARLAGLRGPAELARWLAQACGLRLRSDEGLWVVEGSLPGDLPPAAAMALSVPQMVAGIPSAEGDQSEAEAEVESQAEADVNTEAQPMAEDGDDTCDMAVDSPPAPSRSPERSPPRSSRRARRVTNYAEHALAGVSAMFSEPSPSKRARRTAAATTRPRAAAAAAAASLVPSLTLDQIRQMLQDAGGAVCVPADHAPSLDILRQPHMVPLLVPRSATLPAHVVARRAASTETQQVTDALADRFPLPVIAGRWVPQQQRKYAAYVARGLCRAVNVHAALRGATCQALGSSAAMCKHCVTRKADQPCLFRDVAVLTTLTLVMFDASRVVRTLAAPMFLEPAVEDLLADCADQPPAAWFAHRVGTPAWPAAYCALAVAPLLSPVLARAAKQLDCTVHFAGAEYTALPSVGCSSAPCVRHPLFDGSRELCDACGGELFAVYFMCCVCARELCTRCFDAWDDAPRVRYVGDRKFVGEQSAERAITCRTMPRVPGKPKLAHCKEQFVRVSRLAPATVGRALGVARAAESAARLLGPVDCVGRVAPADCDEFEARVASLQQRTRALHAYAPWEDAPVCVQPGELTLAEFSRLWRRGTVVVVRGLLARLDADVWAPAWWARNRGHEPVTILDCTRKATPIAPPPGTTLSWTIADFFRWFDSPPDSDDDAEAAEPDRARKLRKHVRSGILKLKDYPPSEDFAAKLPKHFSRFMNALPFPEYTHRGGVLNLASRLPRGCLPPDLGPKMYCAYGSTDAVGGHGTTNLHCDMADAVNIMCYAVGNRPDQPAAAWDLFPDACLPALRQYAAQELPPPPSVRPEDPIHDQLTFMTAEHRRAFCERNPGVRTVRVYQNPGDAVFVPAGFAHQVCNYANAVKVAVDFVSPERVSHCARLAEEFRRLPLSHARGSDKLQLDNMLFWTLAADHECGIVPSAEMGNQRGGGGGGDGGGDGQGSSASSDSGASAGANGSTSASASASRSRQERKER